MAILWQIAGLRNRLRRHAVARRPLAEGVCAVGPTQDAVVRALNLEKLGVRDTLAQGMTILERLYGVVARAWKFPINIGFPQGRSEIGSLDLLGNPIQWCPTDVYDLNSRSVVVAWGGREGGSIECPWRFVCPKAVVHGVQSRVHAA